MKQERKNICSMVTDAVLLLCKNGISFGRGIKIQGLLGITVDDGEVFLIQICETLLAEEKDDEYGLMASCAGDEAGNFYQSGTAQDYGTKKERKSNGYRRAVKFEDEAQCEDVDDVIVIKEEIDEFRSETDFQSRTSTSMDFSHGGHESNRYKIWQNSSQDFVPSFADVGPDGRSNDDDFGAFVSEGSPTAGCTASVKEEYNYITNNSEYGQTNTDSYYLPKTRRNRRYGTRHDKAATKPKIEKYQPAKSIVSKYRQQQQQMQQQIQQPSSSLIVVKSLHECGYPGCGKQFRHRRDLLRHQTHKHGRLPKKFLRFQKVWSRAGSSYDAEQFDPGLEYE